MFDITINELKNSGLINESDIVIACMDSPSSAGLMFGAIGAAVAQSMAKRHVMAVNEHYIRIFDVAKNGAYEGSYFGFDRNEITKARMSGVFGSYTIILFVSGKKISFSTQNKFSRLKQKPQIMNLKALFKTF